VAVEQLLNLKSQPMASLVCFHMIMVHWKRVFCIPGWWSKHVCPKYQWL